MNDAGSVVPFSGDGMAMGSAQFDSSHGVDEIGGNVGNVHQRQGGIPGIGIAGKLFDFL